MLVCECTVEHLNDLWIKARASFVLGWVYPCTRCSPLVHERIEDAARGLNVRPLRRQQSLQPVGSTTQAQPRVRVKVNPPSNGRTNGIPSFLAPKESAKFASTHKNVSVSLGCRFAHLLGNMLNT